MDQFKLKVGVAPAYQITRKNFEEQTLKKTPYVQKERNRISNYAVCPKCDNPIQIVGLQKNTSEAGRKPYGRHNKGSIANLARYSEIDYQDCPFSNPSWKKSSGKRPAGSPLANKMLTTMKSEFDIIIKIMRQKTDLEISRNLARKMLENYMLDEGWLYRQATLNNLPWILGESSPAIPLFGQFIKRESGLYQAIHTNCEQVVLEASPLTDNYVQVRNKPGEFINLSFIFYNHHQEIINDGMQESIDFWVFGKNQEHVDVEIFRKTIPITENDLIAAIQKYGTNFRDESLLEIAKEIID